MSKFSILRSSASSMFAAGGLKALILAGSFALFADQSVQAGSLYYDTATTTGLQGGANIWDVGTTADWSSVAAGSNPLLTYTNGSDVYFETGVANTLTLGADVTANSLTQTTNGTATTINIGGVGEDTITDTTGNITNGTASQAFVLNTNLALGASGIFSTSGYDIDLSGVISGAGFGFTKIGSNTVDISGAANTYSGTTTDDGGMIYYNGTATSGTPFGTGSISLIQATGAATNSGFSGRNSSALTLLSINPQEVGTTPVAVALTGGTTSGSTLSFTGGDYINLNKGSDTSLSYTFGSGSGTVLNRVGRGTLALISSAYNVAPASNSLGVTDELIINGTAPTVTNGMVAAYYINAGDNGGGGGTFLTYSAANGFTPVTYDLTNTFTGSTNASKVLINSATTLASSASVYALNLSNTLTINSGTTLTIGDGTDPAGLILDTGAATSGTGVIEFGSSEGILYGGANATVTASIDGTNGITKTQYISTNGSVTLTGLNTYSGVTTVDNGLLIYSNANNQSLGALDGLGNAQNAAGSGQLTFTQAASTAYNIGTITNNTTTGTTGKFTLNGGLNSVTTIGTINGASGSLVNLAGDSTSTTTITNALATAGQTVQFSSGTVNLNSNRNSTSNFDFEGATVNVTTAGDRLDFIGTSAATGGQTVTIAAGTLNIDPTGGYGIRINGDGGPAAGGTVGNTVTVNQTGGSVIFSGGSNNFLQVGSTSGTQTTTYNQSGGTISQLATSLSTNGIFLGADTAGTSTTTFNFSGGKILSLYGVAGSQGAGAKQAFVWTGGTLAVGAFNATNLTSTAGTAVSATTNTLVNRGGTLAPGDIGTAGKTVITGNYAGTGVAGDTMAFDIGGTTAANAFQLTGPAYDVLTVSGTTSLNDALTLSLIGGFTPNNIDTYTILNSAGILSGAFDNVAFGSTLEDTEGTGYFTVTQSGNSVVLSDFTAGAIPEPSTYVMLLGGLGLLIALGRFRQPTV